MKKRTLGLFAVAMMAFTLVYAGPADDEFKAIMDGIRASQPKSRAEALKAVNAKLPGFIEKWKAKSGEAHMALANAYIVMGQISKGKTVEYFGKALAEVEAELKANPDNAEAKKFKTQLGGAIESQKRRAAADAKRQALVGQAAPELNFTDKISDAPATFKELKGKVVVVDFWATWCGPCMRVIPHLIETKKKYGDKIEIIGATKFYKSGVLPAHDGKKAERKGNLSKEDEIELNKQCAKIIGMNYPIVFVPQETNKAYHVSGIPQIVVVDGTGKVRYVAVGAGDHSEFDAIVKKCIDELGGEKKEATAEPKKEEAK